MAAAVVVVVATTAVVVEDEEEEEEDILHCSVDTLIASMCIPHMSQHIVLPRKCQLAFMTRHRHRRDHVKHVLLLQLLRPK